MALALAIAAVVVVADQLTTTWAQDRLSQGPIHVVWTLDLVLQYNSGSAFSLFQGAAPVLGVIAAVVVGILIVVIRRARSNSLAASLGLVVGGAVGNLADRVFRSHNGAVVDFIALHWWPTFNVADASIVIGGILAAVILMKDGRERSGVSGDQADVPSGLPRNPDAGS